MSAVVDNKILFKPTWTIEKIQENATWAYTMEKQVAKNTLSKYGPQAVEEFKMAMRAAKIEYLKTLSVKTPLDFATAVAEFDTNVFGSKVEVWGNDNLAHFVFNPCAVWKALTGSANLTYSRKEEMRKNYCLMIERLINEYGFRSQSISEGERFEFSLWVSDNK